MLKKEINVFDYAGDILKALPKGIIVTSEAEDCINAMTIGWGTLGFEWGVPIFITYIRGSRFTHELIERTGEFTVCIPYGDNITAARKIVGFCGTHSGRDTDKIAQSKATVVDAEIVRPPAIKELPLTLECRVVFSQDEPVNDLPSKFRKFYPAKADDIIADSDKDPHTAYYGEILKAYIIEA